MDVGDRRIGYALSDPDQSIAQPGGVVVRRGRDKDVGTIVALARELGVERVVVGVAGEGRAAQRAMSLGRRIGRRLGVEVWVVDEDFTTVEAEQLLVQADMGRRKRKQVVDKIAAALILEAYLRGAGRRLE